MDTRKDTSLIASIKLGDKEALSELYVRYYNHLSHYGNRIIRRNDIVEECIQDLFLYLYEAHDRIGVIKNVKAYLYVSFRRRIFEKIKSERKRQEVEFPIARSTDIQFSTDDIVFTEVKPHKTNQNLTWALNQLSWRQREAIYLRYYNGLNTSEIAQIMGAADQTILNTLYQALKKLRSITDISKTESL